MIKIIFFWFIIILEIFFVFSYTIYIISLIYSSIKGSFFVPTSNKKLNEIFKEINFINKKKFIDLGSGDGRIVFYIAKKYPSIKAIGLEINPLLIFISKIFLKFKKIKNAEFHKFDITKDKLPQADIIYLFLMPKLINLIEKKLKNAINKNSLIISHGFKISYLKNYLIKIKEDKIFSTFYYSKNKDFLKTC